MPRSVIAIEAKELSCRGCYRPASFAWPLEITMFYYYCGYCLPKVLTPSAQWRSSSPHEDGEVDTLGFASLDAAIAFVMGIDYANDSALEVTLIEPFGEEFLVHVLNKEV